MELNEENMKALVTYLDQIRDPNNKEAEKQLRNASVQPGFSALLLKILEIDQIEMHIRMQAAIFFKTNIIAKFWGDRVNPALQPNDREYIKNVLVDLTLSSPPQVQKFLAVALEIISTHDFPFEWKDLLPNLVKNLSCGDPVRVTSVLKSLNVILKKYRKMMKENDTLQELLFVLPIVQEPLLQLAQMMVKMVQDGNLTSQHLVVVFTALKHIADIFYSLNVVDLPVYFEDHINEWMACFAYILDYQTNDELLVGDEDTTGVVLKLQTVVFRCLNLYGQRYEEEFTPFLQEFMNKSWNVLKQLSLAEKVDRLVGSVIAFLTSLSTGVCHSLFNEQGLLTSVCQEVIIPNMRLRSSDEEEFEDNPVEYLRRDIEGSDSDTRRRSATELVKGLRKHFEAEVTQICSSYINEMLKQYSENPRNNWTAKDVAIYLVTALAVAGNTQSRGATSVNSLVPVMDFYTSQVMPDLMGQAAHPILKADALKFLFTFRNQLPAQEFARVLPAVISALGDKSYVVHSYAAICLDRFFSIREGNTLRYPKDFIAPHISDMLRGLFGVFDVPGSEHNQYAMRTIMRVTGVAEETILSFSQVCVEKLLTILGQLCTGTDSAKFPFFNHYTFETLAIFVRTVGKHNVQAFNQFQGLLNEPIKKILELDIQDFHPYVFQLLALELEVAPASNLEQFMGMLPFFLTETLWQRSGNIPPLTRVLQAYIFRAGTHLVSSEHFTKILGIYSNLIRSKYHDHEAFYLLESIVMYLTPEQFGSYMQGIFVKIFDRLRDSKTNKLVRCFLVFLCVFISKHGAETLIQFIDQIQQNLFKNLIDTFFPKILEIEGRIERKVVQVALARMLFSVMLKEPYSTSWATIMSIAINSIQHTASQATLDLNVDSNNNNNTSGTNTDRIDDDNISGGANYSRLVNAVKSDADPLPDITSGPAYFSQLIKQNNGSITSQIHQLSSPDQQSLMTILEQN